MQLDIVVNVSTNIIRLSSTYIKQMLRFFFRFLEINFGGGTSYYDLYRDIKISTYSLRLIIEPRIIQSIKDRSFGSKRFKRSKILQLLRKSYFDWTAYFYIVSRFLPEPIS